jgi:hypothetical protein
MFICNRGLEHTHLCTHSCDLLRTHAHTLVTFDAHTYRRSFCQLFVWLLPYAELFVQHIMFICNRGLEHTHTQTPAYTVVNFLRTHAHTHTCDL